MAKSDLRIHQKKDNILFKMIRPLELIVSVALIVTFFSLILVAVLDVFNCLELAKDFSNLDANNMTADSFKKLYNSALGVESNIKQIIEIVLSSLFAILITYLVVRIAANGLLFFREWHDYKKWTHSKGLFIFNIIKRAILILLIIIVLSLASSINKMVDEQLYTPIHNMFNSVENVINRVTELLPTGGIDGVNEAWLQDAAPKLNDIFNSISGEIEPNMTILQNTIQGSFLTDVMGKAISLAIFEVIWMVCAIVLCSISKSKASRISIVENSSSESKKEEKDEKKSSKEEKSEDKKDE